MVSNYGLQLTSHNQTKQLFDADAFPECDAAFDFIGGGLGIGVVPGGSGVAFAVDYDVVIAGSTFPTARGGFVDRLEIFFAH